MVGGGLLVEGLVALMLSLGTIVSVVFMDQNGRDSVA